MANDFAYKEIAAWVPKSQRDSGVNLDEGCGDIGQAEAGAADMSSSLPAAEAGRGLDEAFKKINGGKR